MSHAKTPHHPNKSNSDVLKDSKELNHEEKQEIQQEKMLLIPSRTAKPVMIDTAKNTDACKSVVLNLAQKYAPFFEGNICNDHHDKDYLAKHSRGVVIHPLFIGAGIVQVRSKSQILNALKKAGHLK